MKSTAMRFFLLLAVAALAEEAEQVDGGGGAMEAYGITKDNVKKFIDCATKFGKDMADKVADKGLDGIKEFTDKITTAMAEKDPMKAGKAMFDVITEPCEEKTLLEKIFYKMKSGEWKADAEKKLKDAKDWFGKKADTFGNKLKDASDKGKALFDKIFKDGKKVDVDALKTVVATIKTNDDGTWKPAADQPEEVKLLIENDVIAENDGTTKDLVEVAKLE